MSKYFWVLLICFGLNALANHNPPVHVPPYPALWWQVVPKEGAPSWEILPQEAGYGEVILSKRHELGILSNFAATPFIYRGKKYASVEGFWQATKFPERADDFRNQGGIVWPHTRPEVEQQVAFEAKNSGNFGTKMMEKLNINWVTFENQKYIYKEKGESPFYRLIVEVMRAKLQQNPEVRGILLATGDLRLRPDHHESEGQDLEAWKYYEIWMKLRSEIKP